MKKEKKTSQKMRRIKGEEEGGDFLMSESKEK